MHWSSKDQTSASAFKRCIAREESTEPRLGFIMEHRFLNCRLKMRTTENNFENMTQNVGMHLCMAAKGSRKKINM